MKSRSGCTRRDAEQLGDLHERQPEVVVQDEHRPCSTVRRRYARSSSSRSAIADVPSGAPGMSMGRTVTDARHGRVRWDSS
jgi:hypothetical protein